MLRLIVLVIITFIIFEATTFGWRIRSKLFLKTQDNELSQRLKSHVYKLSYEIGDRSIFAYKNLDDAAKYIAEQFRAFGYEIEFQEYNILNKRAKNIIAIKQGTDGEEEVVIVGAHYDTCFNPGADDNASGVGGMLEMARAFFDKETARTIKFIAFVNEEPPFFKSDNMGSRVYAKKARQGNENITAVIILESIGYYTDRPNSQRYPLLLGPFYPNKGNFIAVVGNFASRRLVNEVVAGFKKHTLFPVESLIGPGFIPGVDFSDHWSFWKEGYLAVMITDSALYRNPDYHQNSDTYDKLNYEHMAEVIRGLIGVLQTNNRR